MMRANPTRTYTFTFYDDGDMIAQSNDGGVAESEIAMIYLWASKAVKTWPPTFTVRKLFTRIDQWVKAQKKRNKR